MLSLIKSSHSLLLLLSAVASAAPSPIAANEFVERREAPVPVYTELVRNGGFRSPGVGFPSWTVSDVSTDWDVSDTVAGDLLFDIISYVSPGDVNVTPSQPTLSQTIPLVPGKQYTFQVWTFVYASDYDTPCTVEAFVGSQSVASRSVKSSKERSWQKIKGTFTASTGAGANVLKIKFKAANPGFCNIEIDDVSVQAV